MEISGKIIAKLPPQGGTSKAGRAWKKQEYVLETHDTFPRKVKFDFFGDRVDQYPLAIGDEVTISFDIESREFNERWYTDIHGWKAEKASAPTDIAPGATDFGQPAPGFGQPVAPASDPFAPGASDSNDDLPF